MTRLSFKLTGLDLSRILKDMSYSIYRGRRKQNRRVPKMRPIEKGKS